MTAGFSKCLGPRQYIGPWRIGWPWQIWKGWRDSKRALLEPGLSSSSSYHPWCDRVLKDYSQMREPIFPTPFTTAPIRTAVEGQWLSLSGQEVILTSKEWRDPAWLDSWLPKPCVRVLYPYIFGNRIGLHNLNIKRNCNKFLKHEWSMTQNDAVLFLLLVVSRELIVVTTCGTNPTVSQRDVGDVDATTSAGTRDALIREEECLSNPSITEGINCSSTRIIWKLDMAMGWLT